MVKINSTYDYTESMNETHVISIIFYSLRLWRNGLRFFGGVERRGFYKKQVFHKKSKKFGNHVIGRK